MPVALDMTVDISHYTYLSVGLDITVDIYHIYHIYKLEKVNCKSSANSKNHKKQKKPFWNKHLHDLWNDVCAKKKLFNKCKSGSKSKIKGQYCQVRKLFNIIIQKYKRQYQAQEIVNIDHHCKQDQRQMWNYIGKIGIAEERKISIPAVVKVDNNTSFEKQEVLDAWKSHFDKVYNDESMANYDEHLAIVKRDVPVISNVPGPDVLNKTIELEEVRAAVFRVKLRKAPGVDNIPAEVLRNDQCIKLLILFVIIVLVQVLFQQTGRGVLLAQSPKEVIGIDYCQQTIGV